MSTELLPIIQPIPPIPIPWYKTEEYVPIWFALLCFGITIVLSIDNIGMPHIEHWTDNPNGWQIFDHWPLVTLTLVFLIFTHGILQKKQAIGQYLILSLIVLISQILGSYTYFNQNGFGSSVWAILFGMCLAPFGFLKNCLSLEFFIKIGIILLAIDLREFKDVGTYQGFMVAWVETSLLVIIVYFFGTIVIKQDKEYSLITACGLSICGSSMVISIADTLKINKDMPSSLIAIMSIFTIPHIPLLPLIGSYYQMTNDVEGAWIGGCIDSTGAVLASANLSGNEKTIKMAIIIKMLQNILIAPITLIITAVWYKTFSPMILWTKSPKFILGFLFVGLLTTLLPYPKLAKNSFYLSEWFSSFSFVLIGSDIHLCALPVHAKNFGKIWFLYLIGQSLDIFTTLGVSILVYR